MTRCLTCRKATAGRPQNPWNPFCSERCKLVDLGKWLGEEYRVPSAPPQEGDEHEQVNLDEAPEDAASPVFKDEKLVH